jgi:GrpB-like predicted nucleotidyltransferase (UPF0157 family)
MGRPVVVVDHDPAWAEQFEALRQVLGGALGDVAMRIEHVGSTSVVGLAAKPVLDIDVVIESRDKLSAAIERLATLGYHHEGDGDVPGREAFGRRDGTCPVVDPPRTWLRHHLYVCPQNSCELARHLAFRDWLRTHDEDARHYASLKRELARRHPNDVNAYCEAKTDFVEAILARAMGHAPAHDAGG